MAPKIFFPLPLMSVKETSETPSRSPRGLGNTCRRRGVAKILIGLRFWM